jgi:hypothetical protein
VNELSPDPRFAGVRVPTPSIPDDDGAAAVELTSRLEEFAAGAVDGAMVLDALSRSRLLVPVVAVLTESEVGEDGLRQEKHSSMATVLVQRPDGGRALLAFSGIESLTRWRAEARPVPLVAPLAARAAVDEGAETLLIDVAGPVPFAVSDSELLLVAAVSRSAGEPCDDPVLLATLRRLVRAEERVSSATLHPGSAEGANGESATSYGAKAPAVLTLAITGVDRSWLGELVQRIASDRVVARLLPEGLRIQDVPAPVFADTPDVVPRPGRHL